MSSLRPLIPLLVAAGILLGGNGLQSTLIALRGAEEGFSAATIGWIGTFYFAGFCLGCFVIVRMIRSVGHIRVFAALAALGASGTLILGLAVDPIVWMVMRFAIGFCFAGLFTAIESWLNSGVNNADRARVLALYRIIDLGSVTGAQFLIPVFQVDGITIFGVMTIMVTLSLVPVSLGDRSNPHIPENVKLDLPHAWAISPLAAIGCIAVGLTNSAFRTLSPVYAQAIGLSVTDVATFVSVSIIGGAVIQYPLGYLSDRLDRRVVTIGTTGAGLVAALALGFTASSSALANFVMVFIFGAFCMPLYSLFAAHANDYASKDEFVLVNAALMLFYSFGAVGGPIAFAYVMEIGGPPALFLAIGAVYALLIAVILYRMRARAPAPREERGRFTAMLRTSPIFARLAKRAGTRKKEDINRALLSQGETD